MVEKSTTDGHRIAQLLASELTGLAVGPLADVRVVDADSETTATADGTLAYRIAYDGTRVGTVSLFPDHARVELACGADVSDGAPWDSLAAVEATDESIGFAVESGRAVKAAVDAVERVLGDDD